MSRETEKAKRKNIIIAWTLMVILFAGVILIFNKA